MFAITGILTLLGTLNAIQVNFAGSFVTSQNGFQTLAAKGPAEGPITGPDGLTVSLDAFPNKTRLLNRSKPGTFTINTSQAEVEGFTQQLVRYDMYMSSLADIQIQQGVQQGIDILVEGFLADTPYECTLYWAGGLYNDGRQFDILKNDQVLYGSFKPDTVCPPSADAATLCPFTVAIPPAAVPTPVKITLNSRTNQLGPSAAFMVCDVVAPPPASI